MQGKLPAMILIAPAPQCVSINFDRTVTCLIFGRCAFYFVENGETLIEDKCILLFFNLMNYKTVKETVFSNPE
jgi:hypothetical protein